MRGFAEKGFEATGIREIAALAGSNVAAISYHFGGKEGLRAACAEHIVAADAAACWRPPGRTRRRPRTRGGGGGADRARARPWSRFLLLEPEARLVAGFILREMAQPSSALDTVYDGLFEPRPPPRLRHLGRRHRPRGGGRDGAARGLCRDRARSSTSTSPARWSSAAWAGRRSARAEAEADRRHRRAQPRRPHRGRTEGIVVTGLLCSLPLVARLLACAAPDVLAVGYVEGDYVNLAPVTAAELAEVARPHGRPGRGRRHRRPPGAHRRRDRPGPGARPPATRPRPSSPTCARAAARRRSASPRPRSRRRRCGSPRPSGRPTGRPR